MNGPPADARKGELVLLLGAAQADLARARPLLEVISKSILHFGDVGTGLAVILVAKADRRARVRFHQHFVAVVCQLANAGGRELWGYPKFVTPIPFHLDRKSFSSAVTDPDGDKEIFSLSGRLLPSLPAPPMSLVLYSHHQGNSNVL